LIELQLEALIDERDLREARRCAITCPRADQAERRMQRVRVRIIESDRGLPQFSVEVEAFTCTDGCTLIEQRDELVIDTREGADESTCRKATRDGVLVDIELEPTDRHPASGPVISSTTGGTGGASGGSGFMTSCESLIQPAIRIANRQAAGRMGPHAVQFANRTETNNAALG
jgi:hypothetical protein